MGIYPGQFPSEWELEERERKQKEQKRRKRRGDTPALTDGGQRLDDRDSWALQEERHYQWLEDEYNGVKHRRPRRRKKKTEQETT